MGAFAILSLMSSKPFWQLADISSIADNYCFKGLGNSNILSAVLASVRLGML